MGLKKILWRARGEKRKAAWVKWEDVCTFRKRGVGKKKKNIEAFNRALLGKWVWMLVSERVGLWREVLMEKYGFRDFDKFIGGYYDHKGSHYERNRGLGSKESCSSRRGWGKYELLVFKVGGRSEVVCQIS